jgi:hypothetical protein
LLTRNYFFYFIIAIKNSDFIKHGASPSNFSNLCLAEYDMRIKLMLIWY